MEEFKCSSCVKENIDTINVVRFIDKLDSFLMKNDLDGAYKHINYFINEAKSINDNKGLLTVLNEGLGLSRRLNDKEFGLNSVSEVLNLLNKSEFSVGEAIILVNLATTLNHFDKTNEAIKYYELAKDTFNKYKYTSTYEYASLLNNEAMAYLNIDEYNKSISNIESAIDILKKLDKNVEIAVSLVNLAHVYEAIGLNDKIDKCLDDAWDKITSETNKGETYAYSISKCIPSFRHFERELEAKALEEVVKEIYEG